MEGGEYSEGEEDGEEDEVEGENLQLEVISDSITQTAEAPVWQMNVQPTTASTTVAGASDATPLKVHKCMRMYRSLRQLEDRRSQLEICTCVAVCNYTWQTGSMSVVFCRAC